jgi:hypothetical protein
VHRPRKQWNKRPKIHNFDPNNDDIEEIDVNLPRLIESTRNYDEDYEEDYEDDEAAEDDHPQYVNYKQKEIPQFGYAQQYETRKQVNAMEEFAHEIDVGEDDIQEEIQCEEDYEDYGEGEEDQRRYYYQYDYQQRDYQQHDYQQHDYQQHDYEQDYRKQDYQEDEDQQDYEQQSCDRQEYYQDENEQLEEQEEDEQHEDEQQEEVQQEEELPQN